MDSPFDDRLGGPSHIRPASELGAAEVDQIIADMGRAVPAALLPGGFLGQLNGLLRHLGFRKRAVPGNILDRVPVAIPGGKIHQAVNAGRVGAQGQIDQAEGLDELLPIHRAQEAKAGNAVAYGNLVGGLILALEEDQLFDRQALFDQPLFEPAACEMQSGAMPRQPLDKLGHKRAG